MANPSQSVPVVAPFSTGAVPFVPLARPAPPPVKRPQDPEELRSAIRHQVEHYFSRENLMQDTFLCQQMDAELFVPVVVIAGFNRVRQLTQEDNKLLVSVIEETAICQLDSTKQKVRPKWAVLDTVIVVEGAPRGSEQELQTFVASGPCGEPTARGSEPNGCVAFAFQTEALADQAIGFVNENKFRTSITLSARRKLDTTFKMPLAGGGFGVAPVVDPAYAAAANPYMAYYMPMGYNAYVNPYFMPGAAPASSDMNFANGAPLTGVPAVTPGPSGRGNGQQDFSGGRRGGVHFAQAAPAAGAPSRRGGRGRNVTAPFPTAHAANAGRGNASGERSAHRGTEASKGPSVKRGAAKPATRGESRASGKPDVSFSANDFPALPQTTGSKSSGYAAPFKKFDKGSILEILSKAPQPSKPMFKSEESCVTEEPIGPLQLGTTLPPSVPRQKNVADVATPPKQPADAAAVASDSPSSSSDANGSASPANGTESATKPSGAGLTWASIAQKP